MPRNKGESVKNAAWIGESASLEARASPEHLRMRRGVSSTQTKNHAGADGTLPPPHPEVRAKRASKDALRPFQVSTTQTDPRTNEVRQALAHVTDPELDESVVDLGFVADISVDGDRVSVRFRLPTFWCSANFAFIMAEDMHAALGRLAWVRCTDIRLVDHFAAEKINAGIAAGQGFGDTFGAEAAGDLAALRETFRRKAWLGRMSRLIEALRDQGWTDEAIATLTMSGLAALERDATLAALAERFTDLRRFYGGLAGSNDAAFTTADGKPIAPSTLATILRDIRMTRRSVEANGEMCRILLKERFTHPAAAE
jgi:metal-sulfur cluster biosynthetic enzyme